MKNWLKGKKTYFVLVLGGIIWFLEVAGFIPNGALENSVPVLVMLGGAAVTDKLNRLVNK
jgi:hypothetical protein